MLDHDSCGSIDTSEGSSSSLDIHRFNNASAANSTSSQDFPAETHSETLSWSDREMNIDHFYDDHNKQAKLSDSWGRQSTTIRHHHSAHWPKTILIRYKDVAGHKNSDLMYFQIVLASSDLQAMVYAVCPEQILDDAAEISIQWIDSVRCLKGTVDEGFMLDIPELQDFVVDMTWKPDDHLLVTLEW